MRVMASSHLTPEEGRPPSGASRPLGIGELAARSGVPAATLRSWERRFGFLTPVRTSGGQRRYSDLDLDRVGRVVEARRRGLTLAAAVESVDAPGTSGLRSLFATLRAGHPQVDPIRVSMKVMHALTWSIEDECLAHASRPLLFSCFQDERAFRRAGGRWRELARRAGSAVAFSDFERTDTSTAPVRVALPTDSPMLNEWFVVCADPELSVVLSAWEPPRTEGPGAPRRFEAVLSLDPVVVRDAVTYCREVATGLGVPGRTLEPRSDLGTLEEDPRRSASLLRRFATYADA